MKKAIIYSFHSIKSAKVAEKIFEAFNDISLKKVNAEDIIEEEFLSFDFMILGIPTWFDGELPNYWDEFVPALEDMDLKGKTFALFGLGDQRGYPENFADGIGIMAEVLEHCGAKIIGNSNIEGYTFESSRAVRDDKFLGLVLDQENQARLTSQRVKNWVESLKKELKT